MKKTKFLGIATMALVLGLSGCRNEEPETPEVKWENDKTYHWQLDETGAVNKESKVKHTFADNAEKSEGATCSKAGKKVETCSVCGYDKETTVKQLDHTYVLDTTNSVTATCKVAGKKVEKCLVCEHVNETDLGKAPHNFGAATVISEKVDGVSSAVTKKVCDDCGAVDIIIDAASYTKGDSTSSNAFGNRATDGTIKMDKNGNYVEYVFNLPAEFANCEVALLGYIDYFDDEHDNGSKGHIVNGSATFSLKVNDTAVEVTNTKSFKEMGMASAGDGNGTNTLCSLGGTATLTSGENIITYERVASYNLNVKEIHFISTPAA